ncbi:hypothetical protein FHR24_000010 [Wenyingzhuangia heitensis]|uniref:Transport and Golgi organisation 2 n=1 Tax=Wenyingzhuangia heitensis TaxID=1487859 RepID=A0ABX0U7S0_9FLAO|nr:NRDE family protein [Wenyingzhuangia heitensis]NIJ43571.1 hypothetical protein [Wenyingzhuangia heitensis]
MCTVTYVPTLKGFVFISNRDEQVERETLPPAYYKELDVNLMYPKDNVAGGTWIGVSEQKRLVCLLNGGFIYHDPAIKYPKSRGVVVKSILTCNNLKTTLESIDLTDVAPFTLTVVDWESTNKAYELVWCNKTKHVTVLNADQPYIWSSSTLYTDEVKVLRKEWFAKDILSQKGCVKEKLLKFHQNDSLGSVEIAPKMKRDIVETISTTVVVKEQDKLSMQYFDYVKNETHRFNNLFDKVNV